MAQDAHNWQESSVADCIRAATAQLSNAGIETAQHDAKLLLAHCTQRSLSDIDKAMLMGDAIATLLPDVASESTQAEFDTLLSRRASREPLQYIVGHAPFRYLDLQVGPGVFIPRPETEVVVQEAIDWITMNGLYCPRIVDLCAGSGAIGLSLATEMTGAQVWAVELQMAAAAWTRRNIEQLSATYPDLATNYRFEIADATSAVTLASLNGTIDIVMSNPPYIPQAQIPQQPEVRDYDPDTALYGGSADGMMIPEGIIMRAYQLLHEGGILVMEHDISQADRAVAFALATGFHSARTGYDYTGRPRYVIATK